MSMSVSVVINTLNEEHNIARAIKSIRDFANEIIVVDMQSSDKTVSIAKKLGAKVYPHRPMNYVEPARNFAIAKAKSEWIFILDADEEAQPELLKELSHISVNGLADFVRIPRKNLIFGKWMKHARWWPDYNIRFFKKDVVTWEDEIHSVPITNGRDYNLSEREEFAIVHHHYETVEQYLDRMNRYTTIQSQELLLQGKKVTVRDFIQRPTGEFLSRFFAGEGYKDGVHGLIVSLLQGVSELSVYAKLWQLQGFREEHPPLREFVEAITSSQKDINYWKAHSLLSEKSTLAGRIKRKFKLQ